MNSEVSAGPGDSFSIVTATWRDLNALRRLEQVCFPLDVWPLLDLIGVLTLPNVIRLKATEDGDMIGFIAAEVRRVEGLAWIATLGVLPERRRQGVGTALLEACQARLDVPRVRLSVRASNQSAINLYARLGYRHAGVWSGYYSGGEDAIILEKVL